MGGRLSESIGNRIQAFPKDSWEKEFETAHDCGFDLIEWVFDTYENNPIMIPDGIQKIKFLSAKHGIGINSVCADYFMERMLFNVGNYDLEKNMKVLTNLIKGCNQLGIKILEIPLVDSSSLKNKESEDQLILNLEKILPISEENGVMLTLETDLSPQSFRSLLLRFNHPNIKANHDTGNSAALGYDVKEELTAIGPWIKNIHIKDRKRKGSTVPLGTGDTDFHSFFSTLSKINYDGDIIIQGAREIGNSKIKPEVTCKKYLSYVRQYVDKYLSISHN